MSHDGNSVGGAELPSYAGTLEGREQLRRIRTILHVMPIRANSCFASFLDKSTSGEMSTALSLFTQGITTGCLRGCLGFHVVWWPARLRD